MMTLRLLPEPAGLKPGTGFFRPSSPVAIRLGPNAGEGCRLSARALADELQRLGCPAVIAPTDARIHLAARSSGPAESYELVVAKESVRVTGDGAPGLFYGIQTLLQLVRQCGLRLPCCAIRDRPAFATRGFYLDVTRGRVPRLETLFRLADTLAHLKINQLQLYVEHVFDFAFDPAIGAGCDPLTAGDILALDRHCRERHIALVPSLACFGHMGRVLSLSRYRRLAEIEWPARDWEHVRWIQRLRGATIDPCLPGSQRLLRRMLGDFLPLFSAGAFNMCGDETYDLGRGRNAALVKRRGVGELYLRHIRFMRREAEKRGKRLMFWGDVMLHHPETIPEIPRDCTVLDWGYDRHTDFDKIRRFIDAGLAACACPATRGYRVVFNEVEEARANIAGYARTGLRAGAAGLLTTDWGDMGHFNMPACSAHGLALGAAMAWNPRADEDRTFDRAFSLHFFGDRDGNAAALFRRAGTTGFAEWPMMLTDPDPAYHTRARVARAPRVATLAADLADAFARLRPTALLPPDAHRELALAARAIGVNAERVLLASAPSAARARRLAARMRDFFAAYRKNWLAANRPSGIGELARAFRRAANRVEDVAGGKRRAPVKSGDLP